MFWSKSLTNSQSFTITKKWNWKRRREREKKCHKNRMSKQAHWIRQREKNIYIYTFYLYHVEMRALFLHYFFGDGSRILNERSQRKDIMESWVFVAWCPSLLAFCFFLLSAYPFDLCRLHSLNSIIFILSTGKKRRQDFNQPALFTIFFSVSSWEKKIVKKEKNTSQ